MSAGIDRRLQHLFCRRNGRRGSRSWASARSGKPGSLPSGQGRTDSSRCQDHRSAKRSANHPRRRISLWAAACT